MLNIKICTMNSFLRKGLESQIELTQKKHYLCASKLLILDTTNIPSDVLVKSLNENYCYAIFLIKHEDDENILQYLSLSFQVYFLPLNSSIDFIISTIELIKLGLSQKSACYKKTFDFYNVWVSEKELISINFLFGGYSKQYISNYLNVSIKIVNNLCWTAMRKLKLKWSTRTFELFIILKSINNIVNESANSLIDVCAITKINAKRFSQKNKHMCELFK